MVLNSTSIPALIVIMTDRKSLENNTHLFFELHTRWIPKKRSNIWNTAWDGIIRNYNPRNGMDPSEVIGAAANLDIAKSNLDWADRYQVDWLPNATTSTGLREALRQARFRYSALISKIGSSTSQISLPLHYVVSPNEIEPKSNEDQHILIEKFSGADADNFNVKSMSEITISGFTFYKKDEYLKRLLILESSIAISARKQAEQAQVLSMHLQEGALVYTKEEQVRKQLDRDPVAPPDRTIKNWIAEELLNIPSKVDKPDQSVKLTSDVGLEVEALAAKLAESPESLPAVIDKVRSTPELMEVVKDKRNEVIKAESEFSNAQGDEISGSRKLQQMGYFSSNADKSIIISFPKDRTGNLPPGALPIIGHIRPIQNQPATSSFKFGDIFVKRSGAVQILKVVGDTVPLDIPKIGHIITLEGQNFDNVRCAYLGASLQPVPIVSRGVGSLQLRVSVVSEKEKYIILSDSLTPPLGRSDITNILCLFPISLQTKPATELAITSKDLEAVASAPAVTIIGKFPAGASAFFVSDGIERPATVTIAGDKKAIIKIDSRYFPRKVGGTNTVVVKMTHPDVREAAIASLLLKEDRIMINGVFPSDVSAKEISEDKVNQIQIFGTFDGTLGKNVKVLIGGILCDAKFDQDNLIVVTNFKRVADRAGDLSVFLIFNNSSFEWDGKVKVGP